MAVRIHLTALRDATAEAVRPVFTQLLGAGFDQVPFVEHGGWLWFTTSVWGVKGSDLHEGVKSLGLPGLNITSEDGQRWYLSLFGAGLEPTHLLHDFCYLGGPPEDEANCEREEPEPVDPRLAFLEDDPPPPGPPRIPFDQILGYYEGLWSKPTAEPFRPLAKGLPLEAAFTRFKEWHCQQVADALAARGFPFDREKLLTALRMDSINEMATGDLGNLPWFLDALGLGGHWTEAVREAEANHTAWKAQQAAEAEAAARGDPSDGAGPPGEEQEDDRLEALASEQAIQTLRAKQATLPLTPLAEGPLLPLPGGVIDLFGIACFCSAEDGPPAALFVRPAAGVPLPPLKKSPHFRLQLAAEQLSIGFGDPWLLCRDEAGLRQHAEALVQFLADLPDGTGLELATGTDAQPGSWHRYAGRIENRLWRLDATVPPLTAADLCEALALARNRGDEPVRCRDDGEAEALMAAVRRDDTLHDLGVQRQGLAVSCPYDIGRLSKLLFQLRHGSAWNVADARGHAEAAYRERLQQEREMRRQVVKSARAMAAPHEPELLFKGARTRYWRGSWDSFGDAINKDVRKSIEEGLAALGFTDLGGFVCKQFRNDVRRAWLSADRRSYAVANATRFGIFCLEFVSFFPAGASLTTTTHGEDSFPELGIYYKCVDWMEPADHFAKHQWGLGKFKSQKNLEPVPLEPTLLGVVQRLDAFLQKRALAPPREAVVFEQISMDEAE